MHHILPPLHCERAHAITQHGCSTCVAPAIPLPHPSILTVITGAVPSVAASRGNPSHATHPVHHYQTASIARCVCTNSLLPNTPTLASAAGAPRHWESRCCSSYTWPADQRPPLIGCPTMCRSCAFLPPTADPLLTPPDAALPTCPQCPQHEGWYNRH